ncbi:hypothetical protein LOCC1_G002625, partial [Lachnellula occidentalis]
MSQFPDRSSNSTSSADMEPVIFLMPDFAPNTRLRVFGQDFHVHSSYLKLHSAFFRKFLDSPEKEIDTTSSGFRYEWVTKEDKDGTWSLVWAGSAEKSGTVSDIGKFTGDQNAQISAFTIVIQAIYNWRFIIQSPAQLCLATELADYYCTLPSLSKSLYVAFGRSPEFCDGILNNAIELLEAAVKLRNEVLYRECMTLLMGPWSKPKYLMIKDKKLKQLAALAHHSICCRVLSSQNDLMEDVVGDNDEVVKIYREREREASAKTMYEKPNQSPRLRLPRLYRQLVDGPFGGNYERLLTNNLALFPAAGQEHAGPFMFKAQPGVGGYWCEDYFLCLKIKDDELPWDVNQQD